MKPMTLSMFLVMLFAGLASSQEPAPEAGEKSSLKVLYVGPASDKDPEQPRYIFGEDAKRYLVLKRERASAFEKLLNRHFDNVKILVAADYKVEMSANYDVTIFDERPPVIETVDQGGWSKSIRLPDDFSHAALMIGEVGPFTVGRFGNDYLLDHL